MTESKGAFHTPADVIVDAVTGNPPFGGITDATKVDKPTGGGQANRHCQRHKLHYRVVRQLRATGDCHNPTRRQIREGLVAHGARWRRDTHDGYHLLGQMAGERLYAHGSQRARCQVQPRPQGSCQPEGEEGRLRGGKGGVI